MASTNQSIDQAIMYSMISCPIHPWATNQSLNVIQYRNNVITDGRTLPTYELTCTSHGLLARSLMARKLKTGQQVRGKRILGAHGQFRTHLYVEWG